MGLLGASNINTAWLGFLRYHPEQVNAQQAIGQRGSLDFDVIRQAERQSERPLGNALMQISHFFFVLAFTTSDGQNTPFNLNLHIVFRQPGCSNDDAIFIVTALLDVMRRIGIRGLTTERRFEKVVETIKADGLTEQWCQRKCSSHSKIS